MQSYNNKVTIEFLNQLRTNNEVKKEIQETIELLKVYDPTIPQIYDIIVAILWKDPSAVNEHNFLVIQELERTLENSKRFTPKI